MIKKIFAIMLLMMISLTAMADTGTPVTYTYPGISNMPINLQGGTLEVISDAGISINEDDTFTIDITVHPLSDLPGCYPDPENVRVWVDLNGDGTLDEATELLMDDSQYVTVGEDLSFQSTHSMSLITASTAIDEIVRLGVRASLRYKGTPKITGNCKYGDYLDLYMTTEKTSCRCVKICAVIFSGFEEPGIISEDDPAATTCTWKEKMEMSIQRINDLYSQEGICVEYDQIFEINPADVTITAGNPQVTFTLDDILDDAGNLRHWGNFQVEGDDGTQYIVSLSEVHDDIRDHMDTYCPPYVVNQMDVKVPLVIGFNGYTGDYSHNGGTTGEEMNFDLSGDHPGTTAAHELGHVMGYVASNLQITNDPNLDPSNTSHSRVEGHLMYSTSPDGYGAYGKITPEQGAIIHNYLSSQNFEWVYKEGEDCERVTVYEESQKLVNTYSDLRENEIKTLANLTDDYEEQVAALWATWDEIDEEIQGEINGDNNQTVIDTLRAQQLATQMEAIALQAEGETAVAELSALIDSFGTQAQLDAAILAARIATCDIE